MTSVPSSQACSRNRFRSCSAIPGKANTVCGASVLSCLAVCSVGKRYSRYGPTTGNKLKHASVCSPKWLRPSIALLPLCHETTNGSGGSCSPRASHHAVLEICPSPSRLPQRQSEVASSGLVITAWPAGDCPAVLAANWSPRATSESHPHELTSPASTTTMIPILHTAGRLHFDTLHWTAHSTYHALFILRLYLSIASHRGR